MSTTEVLQDIKTRAANVGLNLVNVKPIGFVQDGQRQEFEFKIETEGELKNLGNFLYHLDDSPYLISINNTQINAQSQGRLLKIQLLLKADLSAG